MKKIISFGIVLAVLISVCSVSVFAQETKLSPVLKTALTLLKPEDHMTVEALTYGKNAEEAIAAISDVQIIEVGDGTVRLDLSASAVKAVSELPEVMMLSYVYDGSLSLEQLGVSFERMEYLSEFLLAYPEFGIDSLVGEYAAEYDEIYTHVSEENTVDWSIIRVSSGFSDDVYVSAIVGGRRIHLAGKEFPFAIRYALYDVTKNEFTDPYYHPEAFDTYADLNKVWNSLPLSDIAVDLPYVSSQLVSAARAYFRNDTIEASDLLITNCEKLDENRSVMHLKLSTMLYPAVMTHREFGRYTMETAIPVPVYFDSEKLIDFDSAYRRGLVSSEEADALLDVRWLGLTKSETKKGDADCDKKVTILDATMIQKRLASVVGVNAIDAENADFDNDKEVTILDATGIQKQLAGME